MLRKRLHPVWCYDLRDRSWTPDTGAVRHNLRALLSRWGIVPTATARYVARINVSQLLTAVTAPEEDWTPIPPAYTREPDWRDWMKSLNETAAYWMGLRREDDITFAAEKAAAVSVALAADIYDMARPTWRPAAVPQKFDAYYVCGNGKDILHSAERLVRHAWRADVLSWADALFRARRRVPSVSALRTLR